MILQKAKINDIALIQELARKSWENAYENILSNEQIEYMLTTMYSDKEILTHLNNPNYHYFLLINEISEKAEGFLGFENNYEEFTTKLHRIYLTPESKGKGIGKAALEFLKKQITKVGNNKIILTVNKNNSARHFYESQGFEVYAEGIFDIGNNYVMDDYLMEWRKF